MENSNLTMAQAVAEAASVFEDGNEDAASLQGGRKRRPA
jgi:hypothetical protein